MKEIPTREQCTGQQMGILLSVLATLHPYILEGYRGGELPKEIDGGAHAAATTTFINACDRIDNILQQTDRWTLDKQNELYDSAVAFNKAQTAVSQAALRPSVYLKPLLQAYQDKYVAYWGTAAGFIVGIGTTPEEAYLDFDAAWKRQPENQHHKPKPSDLSPKKK